MLSLVDRNFINIIRDYVFKILKINIILLKDNQEIFANKSL